MIVITDKRMCCGCSACVEACPAECIAWTADDEGFRYPVVDVPRCMHCDRCDDVCPMLGPLPGIVPEQIAAVKNPDENIRTESSSGGVFSMLAQRTFESGGAVFGAAFTPDWTVRHTAAENMAGLVPLRGSKYMQSDMDGCFRRIEKTLRDGRQVLFSGTSCQTAGLRKMLGRDPKLLLVDVVCHSIPSPKVWATYLDETLAAKGFRREDVSRVTFRDKSLGWKNFSVAVAVREEGGEEKIVLSQPSRENAYMRGFLKGLYSRPACADCPAKAFASGADLTIADFWGADEFYPADDDDRGITLVFALTAKGRDALAALDTEMLSVTPGQAVKHNPRIMSPAEPHPRRAEFFEGLGVVQVEDMVWRYAKSSPRQKIAAKIKRQ